LPLSLAIFLPLAVLSYWRYAEQRQKGITEAYRSVIVLFAIGGVALTVPRPEISPEESVEMSSDERSRTDYGGDTSSAELVDANLSIVTYYVDIPSPRPAGSPTAAASLSASAA
jgi:hypothetical protein